jgi:formaldehyde-activating enzyme involved in methanogenesis
MITIDQIVVQSATTETEERAILLQGPIQTPVHKAVMKENLTQEEKDLWDAFVLMLKSKSAE